MHNMKMEIQLCETVDALAPVHRNRKTLLEKLQTNQIDLQVKTSIRMTLKIASTCPLNFAQ